MGHPDSSHMPESLRTTAIQKPRSISMEEKLKNTKFLQKSEKEINYQNKCETLE